MKQPAQTELEALQAEKDFLTGELENPAYPKDCIMHAKMTTRIKNIEREITELLNWR